jgi:hypothetical protein
MEMMDIALGSYRSVKIVSSVDVGISHDGCGTPDSNPDRTNYFIEPINCTNAQFLDWFLETESGRDFCSDGEMLIDIGGSTMSLTIGDTLTVGFSEWFKAWLDRSADYGKCAIASAVEKALANI